MQRRYAQLVSEHLRAASPLASGPAALPRLAQAFASTQAAWRFFANPSATLATRIEPLHAAARAADAETASDYQLVVHDWSNLNYHRHTAKADQILFSKGSDRGYALATALLVDADDGSPLAPLQVRLPEVVADLERRQAFGEEREVLYHGRPAVQTVAEAAVTLSRPAYRNRKGRRRVVRGQPLALRLVVSQVRDADGALLAQWCLLSNAPAGVAADDLALWYYWRWRIESFFKLLKAAGQQLEAWQQESAVAIAKRLLVACMACVVVWQAARLEGEEGDSLRALLVRLSGRQRKRGQAFTLPALLAGLWVLLAMTEVAKEYEPEELRRLAALILPSHDHPDSG